MPKKKQESTPVLPGQVIIGDATIEPDYADIANAQIDAEAFWDTTSWWIRTERRVAGKEATDKSGKWLLRIKEEDAMKAWHTIRLATEYGVLGVAAKISTAKPNPRGTPGVRLICVYTYDSDDKSDVMRVRDVLRLLGHAEELCYKTDEDTHSGKYYKKGETSVCKYKT